jgi:hypothetical protein
LVPSRLTQKAKMPRPIWVAPKPAYAGILKQLNLPCSPNGGGARSSLISRNNEPLVRMPPSGARPDASLIRRLATPQPIKDWSLTSLKEKLIKIRRESGQPWPLCRVPDGRGRHPKTLFADILRMIAELRQPHAASTA